MPFIVNGGVRIYYEVEEGEGEQLVFVHGWTANMNFWREQREHFRGKCRMLFLDNRGHGRSEKPYSRDFYRFENFVSDLAAVVDDASFEDFILVAHSFGTMIAMKYCLDNPRKVKGLILIGGGARIRTLHRLAYPLGVLVGNLAFRTSAKLVANMAFGRRAGKLKEWGLREALEKTPKFAALNTYWTLTTIDLRMEAKKIKKPTLIIVGNEDALLPVSKSQELARLIKNSKLVVVPRAGHCVMLERPGVVNKLMEKFIKDIAT
ncbi:MAG: alpha/beta hydrolase [Archaeoglobaceae archaeon]